MTKYIVLVGCNYTSAEGKSVRHEPGDVVDNFPESSAAAFLAAGAIATEEELAERAAAVEARFNEAVERLKADEAPAVALPFHAVDGKVHHTRADCTVGNNVEPQTRADGTGGLKKCRDCTRLEREGQE